MHCQHPLVALTTRQQQHDMLLPALLITSRVLPYLISFEHTSCATAALPCMYCSWLPHCTIGTVLLMELRLTTLTVRL
jgi:hypothetical protein